MSYLFDTDAISELLRPRPNPQYVSWLSAVPRAEQHTSALVVGELYKGAYRSTNPDRLIEKIETRILPAVTVVPFDVSTAKVYGEIDASLIRAGKRLAELDLLIASTAIHHGLELVTGNVRHFFRVPGLTVNTTLADARAASGRS